MKEGANINAGNIAFALRTSLGCDIISSMDIMDEVPNLEGCVCEQLLSCEEYFGDRHVGNYGLLLKVENGKWHLVFFDYFPLFWKQWDDLPKVEKSSSLHSLFFEVGARFRVADQEVAKVEIVEVESVREVRFLFANDVQIKLRHDLNAWAKQELYFRCTDCEDWQIYLP